MSVDTAESISQFLKLYEIKRTSIMGGEFFCNPDWLHIFKILLPNLDYCRLVTNGDWAKDKDFLKQLLPYNDRMSIAISEDRWHSNKFTKQAVEQCEELNFHWALPSEEMQRDTALVPVGRLEYNPSGFYGMFSAYCSNPAQHYSFLIDEIGDIFKCSFGKKKYTNIKKHLDGSFLVKFKEFNKKFYQRSPMNCYRCTSMF
jgi:MoaA/NifB/PqqE/SkfB family radical SAM enzyme